MTRWTRQSQPGGGLVLTVSGRPGPPPLRCETADGGRMLLRQQDRPLLLGRADTEGCCRDLSLHRLDAYRSPLPPLSSTAQRSTADWTHRYAHWLEESPGVPVHDGRWQLSPRSAFAPGIWTEDLVRDWPGGSLELYCGGGWHGVLPLRRLSPPDAPRVKAYRKHVREGTLAPVLLWWVTFLDGWLILDGHDRAVAALAEGGEPPCLELVRLTGDEQWRRTADELTEAYRRQAERPAAPHQRAALERGYADTMTSLPYDGAPTLTWPLAGATVTWDDLAARTVLECPRD
ncbi:hypothetical protein ACFUN7_17300 [Streptomyces sp. NPDC057236]|uniref:hypothetical protein n=1 Tax=Streptomyces sp. NPDC057236 TaxID=3346059 RepID=UPI003635CA3B